MLQNYFKLAWRNLVKHRFYSLINIIGLATGCTFTFLIGGYVWTELQVNSQLRNVKNQYIIQSRWKDPNMGYEIATFGPLAEALKTEYPNLVANYYRWDGITSTVSKGTKHFREGLQLGDSTLLTMFGFPLLYGDAKTALNHPFSVVLTASNAIKYFGKTDVVGETLSIESFSGTKHDFAITAVLKDLPYNSVTNLTKTINNQIFLPVSAMAFFGRDNIQQWGNVNIASYVELKEGVTPQDLQKPIKQLVRQHASPNIVANFQPQLISLKQYYLTGDNGMVKKMLYTLSGIALFILLMAIINFVNIAISRSAKRLREIGVRKVMGGMREQLLLQFLIESIVLSCSATLIALLAYPVLRNYFSDLLGREVPAFSAYPSTFVIIPVVIAITVGLMAGIYPALVLSSFNAVDSLKGKLTSVKEGVLFRKSLVAFQFCTATIVFIGAIIISKQVTYFFSNDLGYNKEYIIAAKLPRNWSLAGVEHMEAMREEFKGMPELRDISLSFEIPDGANAGSFPLYRVGADSANAVVMQQLTTDENYAAVYQIPMQAGIFFKTPYQAVDSFRVVLNETAAKALGWQDATEAVGQQVKIAGAPFVLTISGVIKDFHFGSMQQAVAPIAFLHVRFGTVYRYFSFKVKPGNIAATLGALQKKWTSLFPDTPFDYSFMEDSLKRIYASELQLKKASYAATTLAFIIVLLGVIGLISLSIQKRTKEIGIRKVLGAPVTGIMSLFLKEFLILIILAGIVACPVAYLIMQSWLNHYAYRIPFTAQPFIGATVVLAFVTMALICLQTIKVAYENPVKNLRTE